ncbi:MAG: transglycosylase SLT domain-containing protein [Actinomycetota bacterium]|nr:transglycosylase SLT domain-containing protein [Actinomycetota bacterium]
MLRRPGLSTVLLAGGLVLLVLVIVFALRGTGDGDEDATNPPTGSEAGEQATPPPDDRTLPPADGPIPTEATGLAEQLAAVTRRLRTAIDGYTESGAQVRLGPSEEIEFLALRQQRIYFRLSPREALGDQTVDLLPDDVRAEGRNTLAARRALRRLAQDEPPPQNIQTVLPEAPGQLRRYYNTAEQRTGVSAELLTAVNFVESAFGRLRAEDPDGARGPMQLTPTEWEAYGMGGDIDSPRDSIMAAARLLADAGAPGDARAALIALGGSEDYASAVLQHAFAIERDPRHFYALYSWQVFAADGEGGIERLTGPGRR